MFRCFECKKEYKEKPEYCECGNDTFEFVQEVVKPEKKPQKSQKRELSLDEKYKLMSWGFFLICIVFSIIVWLIPVREQAVKNEEKPVSATAEPKKNIPNIDKFWDSTPPKYSANVQPEPETANKEVIPLNVNPYENKVAKLVDQTNRQNLTQQSKPQAKPATQQQAKKTEQKKSTQAIKPAPVQNKPKEQAKSTQQKNVQPKTQNVQEQTKPKTQQVQEQPKPKQQTQEVKPAEQPKKTYNPNSQAMLKYKGELRAALFRKLPVGSVKGSGTCSVHFAVDSTGKLINRGFTKQSDNKSLNDAVYYMMMSVPKFTAPPAEYSGEKINMNIKFNNGSYEITIN